jgi:hypothetical protein
MELPRIKPAHDAVKVVFRVSGEGSEERIAVRMLIEFQELDQLTSDERLKLELWLKLKNSAETSLAVEWCLGDTLPEIGSAVSRTDLLRLLDENISKLSRLAKERAAIAASKN